MELIQSNKIKAPLKSFGSLLDTLFQLFDPKAVALFVPDRINGQFKLSQCRTQDKANAQAYLGSLNIPVLLNSFQEQEIIFASTPEIENFFKKKPAHWPMKFFLSLPLKGRKHFWGFINIYKFSPLPCLTNEQKKLLLFLVKRTVDQMDGGQSHSFSRGTLHKLISEFIKSLEMRDQYTCLHSERVQLLTRLVMEALNRPEQEIKLTTEAAALHDVGKVFIDLETLNSVKTLTKEQIRLFQTHPEKGGVILEAFKELRELAPLVYHHHECFNGSGYPRGLAGNKIPFGSRVIAVVDSYDAMTSDRCYRKAMRHQEAAQELLQNSGTQFDPEVVKVFLQKIEECFENKELNPLLSHIKH